MGWEGEDTIGGGEGRGFPPVGDGGPGGKGDREWRVGGEVGREREVGVRPASRL